MLFEPYTRRHSSRQASIAWMSPNDIVPCLWENAGGVRDSIAQQLPIRCIQNAAVGFEHERGHE